PRAGRHPHRRIADHAGGPRRRAGRGPDPRPAAARPAADLLVLQEDSRRQQLLAAGRAVRVHAHRRAVQPRHLSGLLPQGGRAAARRCSAGPWSRPGAGQEAARRLAVGVHLRAIRRARGRVSSLIMAAWMPPPSWNRPPAGAAHIYYTSGTTGRPKGVVLTRANLEAHVRLSLRALAFDKRDVWLHAAPMFHLADAWAVWTATAAGATHVLLKRFDPAAAF